MYFGCCIVNFSRFLGSLSQIYVFKFCFFKDSQCNRYMDIGHIGQVISGITGFFFTLRQIICFTIISLIIFYIWITNNSRQLLTFFEITINICCWFYTYIYKNKFIWAAAKIYILWIPSSGRYIRRTKLNSNGLKWVLWTVDCRL